MPLAKPAMVGISQTPFSPHIPERMNKNRIGNRSVPNRDTINDRMGRSSAVKKEEKHISAQPTR